MKQHIEHDEERLAEIERLMCGPLEPEERKALRREYLDIWDAMEPKKEAA